MEGSSAVQAGVGADMALAYSGFDGEVLRRLHAILAPARSFYFLFLRSVRALCYFLCSQLCCSTPRQQALFQARHVSHARQAVIPDTLLGDKDDVTDAELFACISGAFYPREPEVCAELRV